MGSFGTVYECSIAGRRLAEAQTIAELESEWQAAQQNFQKSWERRGHHLLIMVHDDYSEISDEDAIQVVSTINTLGKNVPVDVILHTHGGYLGPAIQIADVLVRRKRTESFVPIFAHSAGTLIALATQKVHLAKGAALGPLDLQIRLPDYYEGPARDLIEIADKLGEDANVVIQLASRQARQALEKHAADVCAATNRTHKGLFGWRGCQLANALTRGDVLHSRGINFKAAKKLHINVAKEIPKAVYAIISTRLTQLRRLRELQREQHFVETHRQGHPTHARDRPSLIPAG